jgi:hypothetical protein
LRPVLAQAVEHFRGQQGSDGGFAYRRDLGQSSSSPSMTCAGLMALAMGHELVTPQQIARDQAIEKGFAYLVKHFGKNTGGELYGADNAKFVDQKGIIDYYTAWSLERTAMIYGLKTVGRNDWYAWASKQLVAAQLPDGSFQRNGSSFNALSPASASFALLILKRAHVAPELTTALKQRLDLREVGELNEPASMLPKKDTDSMLPTKENGKKP